MSQNPQKDTYASSSTVILSMTNFQEEYSEGQCGKTEFELLETVRCAIS
jgi:hypothetical protein